jgi:hypothetical protein
MSPLGSSEWGTVVGNDVVHSALGQTECTIDSSPSQFPPYVEF